MIKSGYLKKNGTVAFGTACLFVSVAASYAAVPTTIDGTYGTVVIGDMPGMLDRGAELAKKVSPGISGEAIRGQLGSMLGDQGLKSIPAGSGLLVIMPKTGRPFLLLETADGKAEAVGDMLKQRLPIPLATKALNGKLLAVSVGEDALANATGAMGTSAAALLEGNDDKFIVATLDADVLLKDKSGQLDSTMKKLAAMAQKADAGTTSTATRLEFVAELIKAVGKRTDVATIKMDISGDGIRFEKTLFPLGGVTLAKPEGPAGQELLKSVAASPDAFTRYESYLDTQSAMETANSINTEVLQAIGVQQPAIDKSAELLKLAAEGFGDGVAGTMALDKNSSANGTYVISVINKEKVLQYLTDAEKEMSTSGALTQMYTAMGLETSMTLQRNVGNIDGEPVHQFSVFFNPVTGSKKAEKMLAAFNKPKTGKFTFVDDKMVMALGNTSIEEAVAAVKAGSVQGATELKSRTKLPEGGAVYADLNFGALASIVSGKNTDAAEALKSFQSTPILEGFYTDEESLRMIIHLPGEMISKGADVAKNMAQKQSAKQDKSDAAIESDTTGSVKK